MALNENFKLDESTKNITNFTEIETSETSIIDTSFTPSINHNPNYIIYSAPKKHLEYTFNENVFKYYTCEMFKIRNLEVEKSKAAASLSYFTSNLGSGGAYNGVTRSVWGIPGSPDFQWYTGALNIDGTKFESIKDKQKHLPTPGKAFYDYTGSTKNISGPYAGCNDAGMGPFPEYFITQGIANIWAGWVTAKYVVEGEVDLIVRTSKTAYESVTMSFHQFMAATKTLQQGTTSLNGNMYPYYRMTNIPKSEGPCDKSTINGVIGVDRIRLIAVRYYEGSSNYTFENDRGKVLYPMYNYCPIRYNPIQCTADSFDYNENDDINILKAVAQTPYIPGKDEQVSNNFITSFMGFICDPNGNLAQDTGIGNDITLRIHEWNDPDSYTNYSPLSLNLSVNATVLPNVEPCSIDFGLAGGILDYHESLLDSYADESADPYANTFEKPLFIIPSFGADINFTKITKKRSYESGGYTFSETVNVIIYMGLDELEKYIPLCLAGTGYAYSDQYYDSFWHPKSYDDYLKSLKVPVINPYTGYHTGDVQPLTESQQWAGDNPLDSGYNGSPFKPPSPSKLSGDVPQLRNVSFKSVFTSSFVFTTEADLKTFAGYLWPTDDNRYEALCKAINFIGSNPIESIVSLQYYPFALELGNVENISLGRIYIPQTAPKIADIQQKGVFRFSTEVESNGNFLDCEPYASYLMYLPFAGYFNVPSAYIVGHTITGEYVIDILTGTIGYQIKCDDRCFMEASGQCSVFMPVTSFDSGSYASGVLQSFIQGQSGAVQNQMITESMSNQEKNRQMNYEVSKANLNASEANTLIGLASDMVGAATGNAVSKKDFAVPVKGAQAVLAGAGMAGLGMLGAAIQRAPDYFASQYGGGIESGRNAMQNEFYNSQSNKQSSVASYSNMSAALSFATAALSSKTQVSGSSSVATLLNAPTAPFIIQIKNDVVQENGGDIAIGELLGYEVRKRGKVKDFRGYTVFANVKLDGVNATEDEKAILLSYLQAGVFI